MSNGMLMLGSSAESVRLFRELEPVLWKQGLIPQVCQFLGNCSEVEEYSRRKRLVLVSVSGTAPQIAEGVETLRRVVKHSVAGMVADEAGHNYCASLVERKEFPETKRVRLFVQLGEGDFRKWQLFVCQGGLRAFAKDLESPDTFTDVASKVDKATARMWGI